MAALLGIHFWSMLAVLKYFEDGCLTELRSKEMYRSSQPGHGDSEPTRTLASSLDTSPELELGAVIVESALKVRLKLNKLFSNSWGSDAAGTGREGDRLAISLATFSTGDRERTVVTEGVGRQVLCKSIEL
jgi:hypothetical protein